MIKVCTTLPDDTEICTTFDPADKSFTATIGDGVATSFTLTHNLGSLDTLLVVREIATGNLSTPPPLLTATSPDTSTLVFGLAPTPGQFQVTLIAP